MISMLGERSRLNPTVEIPPVSLYDDLTACDETELDDFRMYEFKVRRCARGRSHDWTECPYAHPGEKARRRDPRKYRYSGIACPEYRKGSCNRGDLCEFAHGVFECWLHPSRYRTQPCKDGTACTRRVCFFAHTKEQLRVVPQKQVDSYDGSPMRYLISSSPTSTLMSPPTSPPCESPPVSPTWEEVLLSFRRLQLAKVKPASSAWGVGFGAGFGSSPSTPTMTEAEGEQRVESGRGLRAKMFERMSRESNMEKSEPDVDWIFELVN
ncbi:zinc finger CCCH domain-containing protein 35-like [Typha angustifolia]|uniref:zinc finger CCCH domain-containing protein 35-like n=1 Tax=Typha angustifolia TaxID=59011 RepID=UPI003C2CF213